MDQQPVISLKLSKVSTICLQVGDGATPIIKFFEVWDFVLWWEYRLWKIAEVLELVGVEVCVLHLTKCFLQYGKPIVVGIWIRCRR